MITSYRLRSPRASCSPSNTSTGTPICVRASGTRSAAPRTYPTLLSVGTTIGTTRISLRAGTTSGVRRMCEYATTCTPRSNLSRSSPTATARIPTRSFTTPAGRTTENTKRRESPTRSNENPRRTGVGQPSISRPTSPSYGSEPLYTNETVKSRSTSPSAGHTMLVGSSLTSTRGTTRTSRLTSPKA